MPLELGVWRIDAGVTTVEFGPLELEATLETILDSHIEIASPDWMVIGRQVRTHFDKCIDLLAVDSAGNIIALEVKRDRTYRDIVAQLLDYGSWVRKLRDEGREYLSRAWLREPTLEEPVSRPCAEAEWNGEYYVSFGTSEGREWEDARKYGFISAGGGSLVHQNPAPA
jgi:hypothetical protein